MKASISYKVGLFKRLQDPERALGYLQECFKDEDPRVFLIALRDVAEARGGLAKLARAAGIAREHLYQLLSLKGNPELKSLEKILGALGFQLSVEKKRPRKLKEAA